MKTCKFTSMYSGYLEYFVLKYAMIKMNYNDEN